MDANGSTDTAAAGSVISLPGGGGSVSGLGEKFTPDLFTGTAAFSVPIEAPSGRLGTTPQLALTYSTGAGNGPFGLGWRLSLPGVVRKTSRGVPRYGDAGTDAGRPDVFLLSGAEDLVPVPGAASGRTRYRPRTEGLFARIEHVRDGSGDYWEVRSKEGLVTRYGTPRPTGASADWRDLAAVADPANPRRTFGWKVSETVDPVGNLIRYVYRRDHGDEPGHRWDNPVIERMSYADYGDRTDPSFLVEIEFDYEQRPDPHSDRRAGFEVRTSLRCAVIRVVTRATDGVARVAREYRLGYEQAQFTNMSLLTRVDTVGIDDTAAGPDGAGSSGAGSSGAGSSTENLPPLTFGYSRFDPVGRRFEPLSGERLPVTGLDDPALALADLRGSGLPDIVDLGPAPRYWQNAGGGRFELPRPMSEAPPFALGQPGVSVIDADGDGRPDLMVSVGVASGTAPVAGYFPMTFDGGWSRRSFQPYRQVPTVSLADPGVKLVDLDGDGLTDILQNSGDRLLGWLNDADPRRAWSRAEPAGGSVPEVDLADPRVRLADMTGDGLSDLVLLRSGNVSYWPNLGHNRWGTPVAMRRSPRLPDGYDPARLLLGDLDGDGVADLVYVDRGRVMLWGNHSGDSWTETPVVLAGTPTVVDTDQVVLADLHGTGTAGALFSRAADGSGRPHAWFLDITGGVKPHLLETVDNHLGAVTTISYRPSTQEFLRDRTNPVSRWRTTLPFPVQVVSRVEVTDAISGGRLTTEYRYRHGYWDGVEREFRGFAQVDQFDAETLTAPATVPGSGPGGVPDEHFSPPTLTRSWFHPGPVSAAEAGDWTELDLRHEYWDGDAAMLSRSPEQVAFLAGLPRAARRDALRAIRGSRLRTELYALDGGISGTGTGTGTGTGSGDRARASRPYTVTESLPGVREESAPPPAGQPGADRQRIFFPVPLGSRTTQWERGDDPLTRIVVPAGFDAYGMQTGAVDVAVPRGRDPRVADPAAPEPYLAIYATTEYAQRDDADHYQADRVARGTTAELLNDGTPTALELIAAALAGGVRLGVIGHTRTYYDGDEFVGLPLGTLGEHGLPVRAESLAFTGGFLDQQFDPADPAAVTPRPVYLDPAGVAAWPGEYPPEFRSMLPELAGYRHYSATDVPGSPAGYYIVGARHRYDLHDPARTGRGLPLTSLDPLGAPTTSEYDEHDLLVVRRTDGVGLVTTAEYDLRLLKPRRTVEVNGNSSTVEFSPIGLVTARFNRGKDGTGDGVEPSTRSSYDLLAFTERGEPVGVRTERRVHHDTEPGVPAGERDEVLVSVQFSDGFGRIVQTRSQAEDTLFGDPVFGADIIPGVDLAPVGTTVGRIRGPANPDNVIVTGLKVFDNKGHVVQQYEPFFSTGYDYRSPGADEQGQRTLIYYDPRGQSVRTVSPDGSEQLMVLGVPAVLTDPTNYAPSPWVTYTYDANDNAGRTHGDAARMFADHWNTPDSTEIDALGRIVRTVARNGAPEQAGAEMVTRSGYDIQGNVTEVTDQLGRLAFRYVFDLARRRWRVDGLDAGRRDAVLDAVGAAVETRDAKGALLLGGYDVLHRPARVWACDDVSSAVTLRQRMDYGDGGDPDQPADQRAAAAAANLLGRRARHHDEAGLISTDRVDLFGNVLSATRQVISDDAVLAGYRDAATNSWRIVPFRVNWTPAPGQSQEAHDLTLLETTGYVTTVRYDALNRIAEHHFPADVTGHRQVLRPTYNRSGGLDRVDLDGTVFVSRIAYDAKGQRSLIAYGNGFMTRYAYDRHSLRLTRSRSEAFTSADGVTYAPTGAVVQDYGYDYDLVGNVLGVRDRTPGSGIRNNPDAATATDPDLRKLLILGDALDRRFGYDPVYRLLSATGRETAAPPPGDPWLDSPRGADLTLAQPYRETYEYDVAHSMTRMVHSSTGGFVRQFTAGVGTNRLLSIAVGKTRYDYTTDANGNVTGETSSRHYSWSHSDRLVVFATQTPGAEPSVHAQYLYDAAGERVKKLVRRQGGAIEVTHYLGSAFEHHRWSGVRGGENNHLHLMDDRRRIALVRVGAVHPDDRGPAVAVHLADHLGSSTIVLDGAGVVVNREEYTPYGESSFGSYARKRYRFIGRERDESSLVATSARYYAPWTTRWTSCEPQGGLGHPASPPTAENLNSYWYAQANPLRLVDPDGRSPAGGVDLTQKVPPVLGSDAHRDILPVLQARLIFIGFDTQVDNSGLAADLKRNGILTAPGGSLSGKSRGETDLVIRTLEDQRVVGDLYELKPGRLTDSSRTARQVAKQVKFGQRLLFAGNPLFYRAGTVLERLTPLQQADVFAPIIVEKGTIVRTYSVGLGTDEHGKVVPGTIGYSFADVKHPRQEGADARASAEDHLRTPIIQRAPVEHDEDADNDSHDDVDDDDYRPPMTPEQHQQAARNTAGVLTVGAVLLFVARLAILAL